MEFDNSFEVPLPPEKAWAVLLDIPRVVQCMPGAELVEIIDNSTFKGKVTVKLGPVKLNFAGTAKFVEMDPAGRRARAEARGSNSKGRGGANASVQFHLEESPAGSRVSVRTALTLNGSVAQYGRATGLVRELAGQITSEFAQRLRAQIEAGKNAIEQPVSPTSTPEAEKPPRRGREPESLSAGRLLWRAILAFIRRLVTGKTG